MNSLANSSNRWIIALLAIGLFVNLGAVIWVRAPGYMDAEYYFTTAMRIVEGKGFTEPYLWNYLDDPTGIPHPSHLYWMPFTTILASGSMMILGTSFRAAQIPFLILAVTLPIMTAFLSKYLHENQGWAWRSGLLAIFSGFYLPFLLTSDTFILYAWVGCGALWAMVVASRRPGGLRWLGVGILIGLAHLIRTDGFLLLIPAFVTVKWTSHKRVHAIMGLLGGYLLLIGPWWVRNTLIVGQPIPPGNDRALWLLSYDELYTYPGNILTSARWLGSGLISILGARIEALWVNLQRLLIENGVVFLSPFMVLGAYRFRSQPLTRIAILYLAILLFVMSFIFPFAGSRGGFFHSGMAVMPVLWAFVPPGLEIAIRWGAKIRRWDPQQAMMVLGTSVIAIVAILTVVLFWSKAVGSELNEPRWESSLSAYREVGEQLHKLNPSPEVVAVNNPPGFYLATNLECVVIPNGSIDVLRDLIVRYQVGWVVLDVNHPPDLAMLYDEPTSIPWLSNEATLFDSEGREIYLLRVMLESASR
ncbi:MAG: glycosyltransferase family 39 protein [Anaerolineaceae bacterium]|nr:MAG: glycosyltransferase family 39 protein [Anaerolineaceae bacterium]